MARVRTTEVMRFMTDCVIAAGSPRKPAEQLADLLLEADKRGHRSHGLNRLGRYIHDITTGLCNPHNTPKVIKETSATAWVEGNNVLGAQAGDFCTNLAIKKAKDAGVGWISVRGSNHYGIGGYWAKKLADNGLIGVTFTNASPLVAPTRGTKAALGSNPLAIVAPATPETGPFYLDMSTSAVALGKAIKSGCLMPLGGPESSAGYKGFGLAALVDILSGILSGAHYGHHVRKWTPTTTGEPPNLGQTFIGVNPECFARGFEERVSECISYWRKLEPTDPKKPVLAPGDLEKKAATEAEATGVLVYIKSMLDDYDKLAKTLKVEPMRRIQVCE